MTNKVDLKIEVSSLDYLAAFSIAMEVENQGDNIIG